MRSILRFRPSGRIRSHGRSPRRRVRPALVLAVSAVLGAAPAPCTARPAAPPEATVILISLDGTTPEALARADLAALPALARRGAVAARLVPVFPTNTFPNHVTLATGVAPDRHGIVNNSFLDPERGAYRRDDDPTWIEVEPLWSIAARHGIPSASFHWVGSEGPWRNGRGPTHWRRFDPGVGEDEKVAQILAWLDEPDPRLRPRLVTSWFRGADRAGHDHGPDAEAVSRALERQDRELARLVAGLEARGAFGSTTLLLVSDHGMARVERSVDLASALAPLRRDGVRAEISGAGGFATLRISGGGAGSAARAAALAREAGLEAWPRGEAPPELRVGHPRFGDVVVLAPVGTHIASHLSLRRLARGMHGYRPEVPEMGGIFLAAGRGVAPGTELGRVRALDVAPTVLALLGVPPPAWMEGRPLAAIGEPAVAEAAR